MPLLPFWNFVICSRVTFTFTFTLLSDATTKTIRESPCFCTATLQYHSQHQRQHTDYTTIQSDIVATGFGIIYIIRETEHIGTVILTHIPWIFCYFYYDQQIHNYHQSKRQTSVTLTSTKEPYMQPQTHTDCRRVRNTEQVLFYFLVQRQYFNILLI